MPNESEYRQLVKTISVQSGPAVATIFEQIFYHARVKQPCDVCLMNGMVFSDVTIGADFAYALEFEAPVETVLEMLSRIKIVGDGITPVVPVVLENISAVVSMPKTKISKKEINISAAKLRLSEQGSRGETLESFIRRAYQPKSKDRLHYYAARFLTALKRMESHES